MRMQLYGRPFSLYEPQFSVASSEVCGEGEWERISTPLGLRKEIKHLSTVLLHMLCHVSVPGISYCGEQSLVSVSFRILFYK
jgi:hypothetical protein